MEVKLISFLDIPVELQLETRLWRNSPEVAQYFKISHISEHTHLNWLESLKKEQPTTIAFIIEFNSKPIGVTYFHSIDYEKKQADWGIYIYDTSLRGHGIGNNVLTQCLDYAEKKLGISSIYLDVLENNTRAIKLYEKLGFFKVASNSCFLRYKKIINID